MMGEAPAGSRSVRENVSWIRDRARFAVQHPEVAAEILAEIVVRADLAADALDVADRSLNDWSAMGG